MWHSTIMYLAGSPSSASAATEASVLAPTPAEQAHTSSGERRVDEVGDAGVLSRALCVLVYIEPELRADVHEHFTKRRRESWAPCYAIDLVALLWHTRQANRINAARDWCLTVLLLGVMTWVSYVAFGLRPVGFAIVSSAVLAAAAVRMVMVRRNISVRVLMGRLFAYAKRQRRRFFERSAFVALGLVVLGALIAAHPAGRRCLAVIAGGFVAAWLTAVVFSVTSFVIASRVRSGAVPLRSAAGGLPETVVRRADGLSAGNVLVYTRKRASGALGPFVGAGHRLIRWNSPFVDVTLGEEITADNRMPPTQVDLMDLHRRLKESVEDLGLPKLRCEHRLYVDGRALTRSMRPGTGPALLCGPAGPPVTSIPESAVLQRIAEPLDFERGYLCLQVTDWNGDVVVTMFVRAVLERELLHLECSVHGLPELIWRPKDHDKDSSDQDLVKVGGRKKRVPRRLEVPSSIGPAVWRGVKAGTRGYWATLFGATRRIGGSFLRPIADMTTSWRQPTGAGFDYGADTSLREHMALGQRMHYNAFVDTFDHLGRLQVRLTKAFAEYLLSCGIDGQDFVQKSATIINNIENVFNNMVAGAVTFGDNSPANGTVNQPRPTSQAPGGASAPGNA